MKIEIHGIHEGTCSLSGKQGEILVVTIDGHAIHQRALSVKALLSLVRMHASNGQQAKPVATIPMSESESA